MVLTYWGETVSHDELADALLEPGDVGVRGQRLLVAAQERGFRAIAFEGDLALARDYVSRGWPLVVALHAGSGRFHDVVLLGFKEDRVILHDPAEGPLRRMKLGHFEKRWDRSGRWTLLALPEKNR
jgi:ABC-type bacteriocin/lantibiotic exporter with double-glycine peptidase domain